MGLYAMPVLFGCDLVCSAGSPATRAPMPPRPPQHVFSERLSTLSHCGQSGLLQTRTAPIVTPLGIAQGQLVSACPGTSGHACHTMDAGPSYF